MITTGNVAPLHEEIEKLKAENERLREANGRLNRTLSILTSEWMSRLGTSGPLRIRLSSNVDINQ